MRRAWRRSHWPWIQRLIVHFNKRNLALFDKEANLNESPHAASWATRLRLLYDLLERAFDHFTLNRPAAVKRVHQRVALAQAVSPGLYHELAKQYAMSSRIDKIAEELNKIQTVFLENYLSLGPLFILGRGTRSGVFPCPSRKGPRLRELRHMLARSTGGPCRLTAPDRALNKGRALSSLSHMPPARI